MSAFPSSGAAGNPDVEPLDTLPPPALQRAQEERLLRAWKIPTGWRY